MSAVIDIAGVGKKYIIRHQNVSKYPTLRDEIVEGARRLGNALRHPIASREESKRRTLEEFWALRDLDFQVQQGELLGIIGRNGAGKSTLLKILSRITHPTTGKVILRGRVASLLEIGTGFHPDLTGRENIYLNGAILGMTRREIRRKFDEIVAFGEMERFLDTPVKRYSSGMYVRLAFAVAAHLDPEILIVDEVLAVGDMTFQKKCMGKMDEVAKGGRTLLFVSHNVAAVRNLCTSCVMLSAGRLIRHGTTSDVIKEYLSREIAVLTDVRMVPPPSARVGFRRVWITNSEGCLASEVSVLEHFFINIEIEVREAVNDVDIAAIIYTQQETPVTFTNLAQSNGGEIVRLTPGSYHLQVKIEAHFLMPGEYKITLDAVIPNIVSEDTRNSISSFTVLELGSNLAAYTNSGGFGCVLNDFKWRMEKQLPLV